MIHSILRRKKSTLLCNSKKFTLINYFFNYLFEYNNLEWMNLNFFGVRVGMLQKMKIFVWGALFVSTISQSILCYVANQSMFTCGDCPLCHCSSKSV